ncbi:hypothetical protein FQR65_LT03853 [Abscondita terminalis]|nr:hypothetical protein FQR65_LT03853 [Abscondita terminalis]
MTHNHLGASMEKAQGEDIHKNEVERQTSRTEYDATHPRFRAEDPQKIKEFQVANDYYCEQCRLFFAPDIEGLKTHFREDMVRHRPVAFYLINED